MNPSVQQQHAKSHVWFFFFIGRCYRICVDAVVWLMCSLFKKQNQVCEALNACLAVVSFGRSSGNVKLFFPCRFFVFVWSDLARNRNIIYSEPRKLSCQGVDLVISFFFIKRLERISFSWRCELHNSKWGTNQTGPHDVFPRRYLLQSPMQPPSGTVVLVSKPTIEGISDVLVWLQISQSKPNCIRKWVMLESTIRHGLIFSGWNLPHHLRVSTVPFQNHDHDSACLSWILWSPGIYFSWKAKSFKI